MPPLVRRSSVNDGGKRHLVRCTPLLQRLIQQLIDIFHGRIAAEYLLQAHQAAALNAHFLPMG